MKFTKLFYKYDFEKSLRHVKRWLKTDTASITLESEGSDKYLSIIILEIKR